MSFILAELFGAHNVQLGIFSNTLNKESVEINGDIVMYMHLPVFGIICAVFIHGYYLNTPFLKLFYLHNTKVLGEPTPHAKECSATYLTSL
jgi:hypothetical protein